MKQRIRISLAEDYASNDDNLETLRNTVPNDNDRFEYYAGNPILHSQNLRRTNDSLNPPVKPKPTHQKTHQGRKKIRRHHKHAQAFGVPVSDPKRHALPSGENMYYGLIPIEHNPVTHLVPHGMTPGVTASSKIKIQLK